MQRHCTSGESMSPGTVLHLSLSVGNAELLLGLLLPGQGAVLIHCHEGMSLSKQH